ncbi:MAG: hypothetical protein K2G69_08970 [Muribaculaceae bacterium]|nr:hypothetical protein [Muribaculaceae bacterium]
MYVIVILILLFISAVLFPLFYAYNNRIPINESIRKIRKPLFWLFLTSASFLLLITFGLRKIIERGCEETIQVSFVHEKGTLRQAKNCAIISLDDGREYRCIISPKSERLINRQLGSNLYFTKTSGSDSILLTNGTDSMICPIYPYTGGYFIPDFNNDKYRPAYKIPIGKHMGEETTNDRIGFQNEGNTKRQQP